MALRRFPLLGAVGFGGGLRPAIALATVPRPRSEEEEDECDDHGDLTLVLSGIASTGCVAIDNEPPAVDFSYLIHTITFNGTFTLEWVPDENKWRGNLGTYSQDNHGGVTDCSDLDGVSTYYIVGWVSCTAGKLKLYLVSSAAIIEDYPVGFNDGGSPSLIGNETISGFAGGKTVGTPYLGVSGGTATITSA